jgi:putative endonuclease
MTRWRLTKGAQGEQIATDYLKRLGYRIQERNYRCRQGEIDIVAWDGAILAFVEVRTRSGEDLGAPLASVDRRKQDKITCVAMAYVQEHQVRETVLRFDVVAVSCAPDRPPLVAHVPAAFDASPRFLY